MSTSFFNCSYDRKRREYRIHQRDKFGNNMIFYCITKREKDFAEKKFYENEKWEFDQSSLDGHIIGFTKYVPEEKPIIKPISPVDYYYKNEVKDNWTYVLENFQVKLLDENGEQIFLIQENMNKKGDLEWSFLDHFCVGGFYIINKHQKDRIKYSLDDNPHIEYYKTYRFLRNTYLLIVLPKVKFHDRRVGYYLPLNYKQITYDQAKRIYKKIDEHGFESFRIEVGEIHSTRKLRYNFVERIQREKLKQFRAAKHQFECVLKAEAMQMDSSYTETAGLCKIKVPKHYRIENQKERAERHISYLIDHKQKRR